MPKKPENDVIRLSKHLVMLRALSLSYSLGVRDVGNGRHSPRTGYEILTLIEAEAGWVGKRVEHSSAQLRYLKSAYQAAKMNCILQGAGREAEQ